MKRIEDIIQLECLEGVKSVPLGSLLKYKQPTKYRVESTEYSDQHQTPVLTAGQSFILGYTDEVDGIFRAGEKNPVIIFDDFTTSSQWVVFDFKVKSSAMKILINKDDTISSIRYLYHVMKTITYRPSTHARQWISTYSKFSIPLPPLSVQEEIVRILDTFTELEQTLNTELDNRKKQFEWYLDSLLEFSDPSIEWGTIKSIFDMRNGYTPSRKNDEFWTGGTIPWFRMEDIRLNGGILTDSIDHVTPKAVKRNLFPANSLIVATSATIGSHALVTVDFLSNQRFVCLTIKDKYKDQLDPMFAYYYAFKLDEWCLENTNIGNFASVNMTRFRNFLFPLPPLAVQEQIVQKLDTFFALVNDPTVGIPAEIATRRKQYEYYRDKLLTFESAETA